MLYFCPECHSRLYQTGLAFQLYEMVVEFYDLTLDAIVLHEYSFSEVIRYLEVNGFIITAEATPTLIYAIPRMYALDDDETIICCSGRCLCSVIDLKEGRA